MLKSKAKGIIRANYTIYFIDLYFRPLHSENETVGVSGPCTPGVG